MHDKSISGRIFDLTVLSILLTISAAALYPFIYILTLSFSSDHSAISGIPNFDLGAWTLDAYREVTANKLILIGLLNSLLRTVFGVFLTLFVTSIVSYPLAQSEFKHRSSFTFFLVFTMIFSGGLVPVYLLITNIGLVDNRLVYILPTMLTAFNIIILRNFFEAIPISLTESARIEGASEWKILFSLYIPLSTPALATIGLWTAVMHWNMWFDTLLYINDESKQTMQFILQRIVIDNSTEMLEQGILTDVQPMHTPESLKAAATIVTIVPIMILFPFIMKHFKKGIMLGGVKG